MSDKRICELRTHPVMGGAYVVQYIPLHGHSEIATFTGPNALERAIAFAAAYPEGYYDEWRDPENLAQQVEDVDFLS